MQAGADARPLVEEGRGLLLPPGGGVTVPGFVAMNGAPTLVQTTARVQDNDQGLAVTFQCVDATIQTDPSHTKGHPDLWKDDCVELFLDIRHGHEQGPQVVHVLVTAAGLVANDIGGDPGNSVKGLETATQRTPDGWEASIRIPWPSLGGRPAEGTVWGFNLGRSDYPAAAYVGFSPTYRGFWQLQHWGHLVFTSNEFIPETTQARMRCDHERARIFRKLADNPFYSETPSNLAALATSMPGAGMTCVWTADGTRHDFPALMANGSEGTITLPLEAVAVGAVWPIAHVADRLTLSFSGAIPAVQTLTLQVFDGSDWVTWQDGLDFSTDDGRIVLSFEPVATDGLRVLVPADSRPIRLEIHRYLASAGELTWPERVTTPELTRDFLTRPGEPSFETLKLHSLSMPAWALTGLKDTGREQAVYWDGQIHCHGRRLSLLLGEDGLPLGLYRDTLRRNLLEGWMPAVMFQAQVGDMALKQTSFSAYTDSHAQAREAMFVRVQVTNLGKDVFKGPLKLQLRDAPKDPFEGTLGVPIYKPAEDQSVSVWELRDGVLLRNDRIFLVTANAWRADATPSVLAFDLRLAPGESSFIEYVVPSPDWPLEPGEAAGLAGFSHDEALSIFKDYWERLMAPAMKLDLPEKRLEKLYRSVLTQLFISGYGNIIAYGAAPSNYDGAVYGGEEPFAINALAMSGFSEDAQRYLDGSILMPATQAMEDQFRKLSAIGVGLRAIAASDVFRLTRDHRWIQSHVQLLRHGAEWIITSRRETMIMEDGEKPIYYGLLPAGQSGGDFSRTGFALFPNLACWRGLLETAWILEQLGDHATAARYRTEAENFYQTILGVVDRITQRDRKPPFLPLMTDETEPRHGDYYQCQSHFIVNLWPFGMDDPRINLIADFIEADNRAFCGIPRFRDDGVPGGRNLGAGGIDGIYALGLLMQRLRQNRIRDYLLGFYAFQVFNMEHDVFTSRESSRIYSSDAHLRSQVALSDWSDPLTCSSAVGLLLLRHLLVTEAMQGAGEYTGKLLLLYAAPRRWFAPGQRIGVEGAVTHAGKISFEAQTSADGTRISATVFLPEDTSCPALAIRLRHPDAKPMQSVRVNGKPITTFDPEAELVELANPSGTLRIEAAYLIQP